MADIAWSAISGGSQVVRKSIEINVSQNWVAPVNLAGNTIYITASGGGGGGIAWVAAGYTRGACGGNYCLKAPIKVTPSTSYLVTIGAGGAAGVDGNSTSFGSLLTVAGGSKGYGVISPIGLINAGGFYSMSGVKAAVFAVVDAGGSQLTLLSSAPESAGGYTGIGIGNASGTDYYSGPACGYFGNPNASAAAPNNTGAGGGASSSGGFSGGSGKMIIEWDEFL